MFWYEINKEKTLSWEKERKLFTLLNAMPLLSSQRWKKLIQSSLLLFINHQTSNTRYINETKWKKKIKNYIFLHIFVLSIYGFCVRISFIHGKFCYFVLLFHSIYCERASKKQQMFHFNNFLHAMLSIKYFYGSFCFHRTACCLREHR